MALSLPYISVPEWLYHCRTLACQNGSLHCHTLACQNGSLHCHTLACQNGSLHCRTLACQNGSLHCHTLTCQNGSITAVHYSVPEWLPYISVPEWLPSLLACQNGSLHCRISAPVRPASLYIACSFTVIGSLPSAYTYGSSG